MSRYLVLSLQNHFPFNYVLPLKRISVCTEGICAVVNLSVLSKILNIRDIVFDYSPT